MYDAGLYDPLEEEDEVGLATIFPIIYGRAIRKNNVFARYIGSCAGRRRMWG